MWEAPSPVLFNARKHHAGFLRMRISETIAGGKHGLRLLAEELLVTGSELMDLYLGSLTPLEIGATVIETLRSQGHFELPIYRPWITEAGGYRVIDFADDKSRWVLRIGDESECYIHVHPGRWAPQTCRVRANVLKTAVMVVTFAGIHGGDPIDVAIVNRVRREYLDLAPVGRELSGDRGIGAVMNLLKG